MFGGIFRERTVWLSGHTGFKGAWLAEWLLNLGARVHGFSLPPPTTPSLFEQIGLQTRLHHEVGDVRDAGVVRSSVEKADPDFVFHLAAQPLVRVSYEQPLETYAINVMGTAHVLDALRRLNKRCAAVFVTTDKCYENREWHYGYREDDPLGGSDPYSSSKAGAELVIAAYRRSFFGSHPARIASARAGNVIGGGDWAHDRLVPDCIRALQKGQPIGVRNPGATRPWQHVFEPLSGYLWLAALLHNSAANGSAAPGSGLASAFNFGPGQDANRSVAELVDEVLKHWPGRREDRSDPKAVHEAGLLQLSADKARALLGWRPVWSFGETVEHTAGWYRQAALAPARPTLRQFSLDQLARYATRARELKLPWASAEFPSSVL